MGIVFDGENFWLTSYCSNTVSKIKASDGTILGTYPAGNGPWNVAFDGNNVWVTNSFLDGNNWAGTVTKLRASDGTFLGTYPVGINPIALSSTEPISG